MADKVSQKYQVTSQSIVSLQNFKKAVDHPALALRVIKGQVIDNISNNNYKDKYLNITSGLFEDAPDDLENHRMGRWQFEFLKRQGLEPDDYLLDVGCAYLRGGLHFIRYLDEGHYYGMDISQDALDEAARTMEKYDLAKHDPTVFRNSDLQFRDEELGDRQFDYALAQSVFTHLPPTEVEECLANLDRVLKPGGSLLATYYASPDDTVKKFPRAADFGYPFEFFEDAAREYGLTVEELESDHPLDHNLLEVRVGPARSTNSRASAIRDR